MIPLLKRLAGVCQGASLLFPATVALGYLSAFANGSIHLATSRGAWCLALGIPYAFLGYIDYTFLRLRLSRWRRVLYLLVQMALLLGIALTSHFSDQMWLCVFPLVATTVVLLPPAAATVGVAALLGMTIALGAHFFGRGSLLSFSISMVPAFGFVVIFTHVAVKEKSERYRAEALSAEIEKLAVIQERNRLAREIHDSLGHYLTTIHVQLEAARAIHAADPAGALEAVAKAQDLTRDALIEVRRSVGTLQADQAPVPLVARLRDLASVTDGWGAAVTLEVLGEARGLAPEAEHALFRATQEGLTNVRKHARARSARVTLDYRDSARVLMRVLDDGRGAGHGSAGRGLEGLRDRISGLGGHVVAENQPAGGFGLQVEIPA